MRLRHQRLLSSHEVLAKEHADTRAELDLLRAQLASSQESLAALTASLME